MKFLIVFALLAVSVYAELDAEFKSKLMEKVQAAGAECAEKEKATADDIGELMAKKPPSRKEGKCLIACFHEKFGVQGADGKLSLEGAIKSIEPFQKADAAIYGKLKGVTEKCIAEVTKAGGSGDRCEIAAKMAHCGKIESEAVGLDESIIM